MRKQFWKSSEEEEVFVDYLEKMGIAWWIEIITKKPRCIYYFGPFPSSDKAQSSLGGYLEDLEQEKTQVINVDIMQGQPRKLTIFEDEFEGILQGRL
jgi:hypothetical protein